MNASVQTGMFFIMCGIPYGFVEGIDECIIALLWKFVIDKIAKRRTVSCFYAMAIQNPKIRRPYLTLEVP